MEKRQENPKQVFYTPAQFFRMVREQQSWRERFVGWWVYGPKQWVGFFTQFPKLGWMMIKEFKKPPEERWK